MKQLAETEKVFKQLTSKGQQALGDIVRGTGLPAAMVKQALLILVQQNCANAYLQPGEETFRGPRPSFSVYEANVDRVLQIIRHSRFLLHIKDEAGEVAEHIIAQLLQEGRLRMDQILGGVAARMGKPQTEVADTIRNTFISLVQGHYVERCPPCSLPPPAVRPHPNSVKAKKAKTGSDTHAADQASALRSLEDISFDKQRFKVPHELAMEMFADGGGGGGGSGGDQKADGAGGGGGGDGAADGGAAAGVKVKDEPDGGEGGGGGEVEVKEEGGEGVASPGRGRGGRGRGVRGGGRGGRGAKRKVVEAEADGEGDDELAVKAAAPAKKARMRAGTARVDVVAPGAAGGGGGGAAAGGPSSPVPEPAVILWRVNNDEFNRRFRHQAMVSLVREKFDDDAAAVAAAMLSAARPYEVTPKDERSVQLSEEEVESAVNKLIDAGVLKAPPESSVLAVLRSLANDSFEMFTHAGMGPQGSSMYVVNMQRIIDLIMLKQVEAVVKSRYEVAGLRIFRLLALRGQLEQKQVADLAMLPPKDTRELLYRMLAGGFVLLQDIPKTADRAPSRTFYTWRVHMPSLTDVTSAQLYRAAARVYMRLQHEMDKERELLSLLESAKETRTVTFTLTPAQRNAVGRLKRVSEVMETSLQHLDEMIAVFNDY